MSDLPREQAPTRRDDEIAQLQIELGKARREAQDWKVAFIAASRWLYEPTSDWLRTHPERRENEKMDPGALAEYRLIEYGLLKLKREEA